MAGAANPDNMNDIDFDITDIIQYSEKNYRVTGIQRVQLRLMSGIVKIFGGNHARGLAFLGPKGSWQSIDLSFLDTDQEFNATKFLVQTGKLKSSPFPTRNQIRQYLEAYNSRKSLRSLEKAGIHLQAILYPDTPREASLSRIRQAIAGPFAPCVGSIEIRKKNGVMLLKAWEKIRTALGSATPTLLSGGEIGTFTTLLRETNNIHGNVLLLESRTGEELTTLYRQRLFTVYPSLVKGWGLPVSESAWVGKLAAKLLRALQNAPYVATKTEAIRQAALRTWEQVAVRLHELLQGGPDQTHHTAQRPMRTDA